MTPIWHGTTKDGRLHIEEREHFINYLQGLSGSEIEISVRKRRRMRSVTANAFYWAVIVKAISDYTGHDTTEVHAALKHRFLQDLSDPEWPRVKSTTELSVVVAISAKCFGIQSIAWLCALACDTVLAWIKRAASAFSNALLQLAPYSPCGLKLFTPSIWAAI